MAESGLSIGFPELQAEVGFFVGYGRSGWSSAQESEIDGLVQSGVRLVYYPPACDALAKLGLIGYEWTWLRPTKSLSVSAAYSTGTVAIASGVVTLTGGTFPSWAEDGELSVDGSVYSVASRDGDTQITLDDTNVDVDSGTSYSLGRPDYDLPDDFGRLVGDIHFPKDQNRASIKVVAVSQLLAMRATNELASTPRWAATRYKSSTGASGQRQEILFYPTPDTAWDLLYEYDAYSGALSDSYPYPLGGMQYSELYIESCLAVAERRINGMPGEHNDQYERLLVDAIHRDKKHGAQYYGPMGHKEETTQEFRRGLTGGTYPITYKGASI